MVLVNINKVYRNADSWWNYASCINCSSFHEYVLTSQIGFAIDANVKGNEEYYGDSFASSLPKKGLAMLLFIHFKII